MPASPHFITGAELDADRLARAAELKTAPHSSRALDGKTVALTRGESVRDTAYILSRHAALIGLRTGDEAEIGGFAEHASVPVVNLLSPLHHPCQALADLQTMAEALGSLEGRVVTYVGDGNNVARSRLESLVSTDWQDG